VFEFRFGRQPMSVTFDPGNNIVIKQGSTTAGVTTTAPVLAYPGTVDTVQPMGLQLRWHNVVSSAFYRVQISTAAGFMTLVADDSTLTDTTFAAPTLTPSTQYYWRVSARNAGGTSAWSTIGSFMTATQYQMEMMRGWNLVALPVEPENGAVASIFPDAVTVYDYTAGIGYQTVDTLKLGNGYWVKFNAPATVGLFGTPQTSLMRPVVEGWNLIGGLTAEVPLAYVTVAPPGIQASDFFSFDGEMYQEATSLLPRTGYWVKMNAPGYILLSSGKKAQAGK
jgi:hypothetical protein